MTLKIVTATYECDGCSVAMTVELDQGDKLFEVGDGSIYDYAEAVFRGGYTREHEGFASLQGEHHLCPKCTGVVDDWCDARGMGEDYLPSYDEVEAALNAEAGV